MPNNFQIPACVLKLWVGHDAGTYKRTNKNTQTCTDRVDSIAAGGGGDHNSWIKPPSLSASVPANFLARSGRRASKPPFGAAGKYDEFGIRVEKKTTSRRASKPPFCQIFQLDRAVGPPSHCSTPPENTTKWVFQSKKNPPKKSLWANAPDEQ